MPLNISNAEDAYLSGFARWSKFLDDFQEDWYAPLRRAMVGALLDSLDPTLLVQLRKMNPEAFDNVLKMAEE